MDKMETTVQDKNKVIAEFDGYKFIPHDSLNGIKGVFSKPNKRLYILEDLKYHSSWDWLMPVVEKIESLAFEVSIFRRYCNIHRGESIDYGHAGGYTKILAVHEAVYQF